MSYVYSDLPSRRHIRLLVLKPSANPDAPLKFNFQTSNIDEVDDTYEALSYTWGAPVFPHELYTNEDPDSYLKISSNLKDALAKLRKIAQDRVLWVDAVCINQQDNVEKSFQIPMMGDIYRKARGVVTWLGQGEALVEYAIDMLANLSRTTPEKGLKVHYQQALKRIVRLDYFSRRWIIQELVSNHEVTFLYGNASISWLRFQTAFRSLHKATKPITTSASIKVVSRIITLWNYWMKVDMLPEPDPDYYDFKKDRSLRFVASRFPNTGVFDLLKVFDTSVCGDSRDILYTLLALAPDLRATGSSEPGSKEAEKDTIMIAVSYEEDVESVYTKFAQAAVSANKGNAILAARLARPRSPESFSARFPSWVPDWRIKPDTLDHRPLFQGFESLILGNSGPSVMSFRCFDTVYKASFGRQLDMICVHHVLPAHGIMPSEMTEAAKLDIVQSVQSFWTRSAHTNGGQPCT